MKENRKFVRLKVLLPVEYSLVRKHKRTRTHRTMMRNISVGGLSLSVKEEVRNGELMKIEIQVPDWVEPINVVGDVIWHSSTGTKDNPQYEAGVRFREINPLELNKLLDYVYSVAIG